MRRGGEQRWWWFPKKRDDAMRFRSWVSHDRQLLVSAPDNNSQYISRLWMLMTLRLLWGKISPLLMLIIMMVSQFRMNNHLLCLYLMGKNRRGISGRQEIRTDDDDVENDYPMLLTCKSYYSFRWSELYTRIVSQAIGIHKTVAYGNQIRAIRNQLTIGQRMCMLHTPGAEWF